MKHLYVIAAAILVVLSGCGKKQQAAPVQEPAAAEETDMSQYFPTLKAGDAAPDFEAPDILGEQVKLSDFKGKWVVIDFWASWCKDCRAELPAMKKLYAKFDPLGVQFLGVSFDTDKQALVDFGVDNEIEWLTVCNEIKMKENPISAAFGIKWIPTLILVDPEGVFKGFAFHAEDMDKMLANQLGV